MSLANNSIKDQDRLRAFYDRRHPAYNRLVDHWRFLEETYRGGRDWFTNNIFEYHKEGNEEFLKRRKRAYRFNHTREVVELVQKYLFKSRVMRNENDASEAVQDFWKKTTLSGLGIDQFMRTVSVGTSICGRVAVVVDNNFIQEVEVGEGITSTRRAVSVAEAKEQNYRIYAYMVPAKDILDYAFDEDGDGGLLWIKLREIVRDDSDPLESTGDLIERVRLWTRNGWMLYEEQESGELASINGKPGPVKNVILRDQGTHNLNRVPVILADHTIGNDPYHVPGLIDDIAYLDRTVANYLSNLDAIIQDQTFSQLAIPAQSISPGDDLFTKILEMGTKRIFVYDGGAGSSAKPEFISPDPKQAGVILDMVNKLISEIYHTIGLSGERTKQDNAVGIDNSSGVAKAYDFERVNSLLLSKAQACERVENQMVELVSAWAGIDAPKNDCVTYPITFDVMRLNDDLVTAEALSKINAPKEVRREHMRAAANKLFPQMRSDQKTKLKADIDKWLEGDEAPVVSPATPTDEIVASPNRQGSVTANTPANKSSAS